MQSLAVFGDNAAALTRQTNGDAQNVGWYQTLTDDGLLSPDLLDLATESNRQASATLFLGFEPVQGKFKVLRPKAALLAAWRRHTEADAFAGLAPGDLFDELPMVVKQPLLLDAFLLHWLDRDAQLRAATYSMNNFAAFGLDQSLQLDRASKLANSWAEEPEAGRFQRDNKIRRERKQEEADSPVDPEWSADVPAAFPPLMLAASLDRVINQASRVAADVRTNCEILRAGRD